MVDNSKKSVDVRDVTETETEHLRGRGWVFLPGLISAELAGLLLDRAKRLMGDNADEFEQTGNRKQTVFAAYDRPAREDALFALIALHPKLGRNGALLLGADIAVRQLNDNVIAKLPHDRQSAIGGNGRTDYHQDLGSFPMRGDHIAFWIALAEVTPEMGAMRFYEGSHKLGWLAGNSLDWPRVHDCPLSAPLHYRPGDATAHHSQTVHGAPLNITNQPRWAYLLSYFPAHATYTGAPSHWIEGTKSGLEPGKPFDHPDYPIVYDPGTQSGAG